MDTVTVVGLVGIIFLLAFLTESLTEYLLGELFNLVHRLAPDAPWILKIAAVQPTVLKYASAGVGVYLALGVFQLDLVYLLATVLEVGEVIPQSNVGMILTGLSLGRGANFLHQIVSVYLPELPPFHTRMSWDVEE